MLLDQMHPEDIKAVLRKKFGTIVAFQERKGLPSTAVADLFRGRTSKPAREAVEAVLQENAESINLDDNGGGTAAHRLNEAGR